MERGNGLLEAYLSFASVGHDWFKLVYAFVQLRQGEGTSAANEESQRAAGKASSPEPSQ